ncbi:hypothetical protein PAPYR_12739 [Paratrimastix pyriformis]|uniref:Fibronectin type-III domain-containing protein n=1 Tax=Paratrimastix pyriformis TaxID=342808 RepID=A0ABQ8U1C8_9EUKA|nr:hypothetical protein PAPYR_12739 [Paratrimastix pyriformis]
MPLEDLALATVDEVAPTHARVHWPVVALQGTELAGLDDQVEYQVLAREVSLPGAGGGAPVPVGDGNWTVVSAPGPPPNGTAGDWWMRVDAATAPTAGALQPGHRYEWKVRARLSGAGYLFGQSDAGSPTAAPEDVESSPTAETVVLPEQDLGQPTRQALAEDDAVTGPGPAAVRLTGATSADASAPVAELAGDGHTTALDVIALPAELRVVQPETAASWEMPLEDLALATVDEVAPTHARVHWPVVALQGTELAGLDDQVEYQVLAREVSLPGAGGGAPVPVGDGNWTVVSAPGPPPTARRATGGCGSTRPRPPTAGALQPGHRYEWKVRARLSGAGYLFGQSDAGSPTAAPEDVESSPTAETVVLPEQDLGQPTVSLVGPHRLRVAWQRQALAEDDAVTGPGPAAVRLTGATSADASAPVAELAGDGHTTALDVIALPAELNGTYSWVDSESYSPETAASWEMPLEDLALATVDEVAPTHARVHWPVVALQGTELAGLDDQVEYQVLAREVSLPGAGGGAPVPVGDGNWTVVSAPGAAPNGTAGDWWMRPGHRYEWKVRARLSGAGYLFGQSDAGSPTAAPEDVESSPTAETVVLPEQDLGQPTVSLVGPHRLRVAWQRQALAEDDAVTGPGVRYHVWARCTSCAGSPAAVRLTGATSADASAPVAELAGDGHTTALDVIALPAELVGGRSYRFHVRAAGQNGTYSWVDSESYSPETAASWEMPLEDLALATVDEVAPTHARVHWPVVALQGTELAGLDDQVEYQVLAREVSLPGAGGGAPVPVGDGNWTVVSAPGAAPNGTAGDWWMRVDAATAPTAGALQPGHRYEWKVRARLSGAGYLFGQSDAGSPTAAPEDVESSPTAETVVLPEQDLGQPTRQALAEDDAVTGPGVRYHVWARCTSCAGSPAAVRLTGATSADASAPVAELAGDGHTTALDVIALPAELVGGRSYRFHVRAAGQNGTYSWVDSESYSPETAASWEMPLEDLALATVDEVAPTHARVHWPVVALQGTELAGLDDQVEYQVLAREVSLPGAGGGAPVPVGDGNWTVVSAPGPPPTARRATGGCGSTRPRPHGGALQPGHRYEWKVRARLSGAGYLFGQSDAGSPTAAPEDVESSPTAETVVLPEQDLGQPTVSLVGPHRLRVAWQRQALAEDDAVTGPGCGTTCGPGAPAARAARRRCG